MLPAAMHAMVLGDVRKATLRRLDQTIRSAVREFLHLPKDTLKVFLHAHPTDGGLGIPELRLTVPMQRTQRITRLEDTEYRPVRHLTTTEAFRRMKDRCRPPHTTGERIRQEHRRQLLNKVDGAVREAPNHPASYRRVTAPNPPMPGSAFVGAIQVRGSVVATGQRNARSRRGQGFAGCGRLETLGHISQTCTRTHLNRVARHDRALVQLEGYLRDAGATTIKEPSIPTPEGLRKPDLLVATEGSAAVIDVTIVADNADLSAAHQRKVAHYNRREIVEETKTRLNTQHPVHFGSATLNWRGCWARESVTHLKKLGATDHQLAQISIGVIENTYKIIKIFRSTGRQGSARPSRRSQTMTGRPP